jgi:hypothetical protein
MTKRQHALRELLSSERAYACDLGLIKGLMPLALGGLIFFSFSFCTLPSLVCHPPTFPQTLLSLAHGV